MLINVIHPDNTLLTAKKETKSFYKKFMKFSIFEWQTGIFCKSYLVLTKYEESFIKTLSFFLSCLMCIIR